MRIAWRGWSVAWAAVLGAVVLAGAAATGAEEAPADPDPAVVAQARGRAQLEDLLAPLLQGSGVWRAANHEHVAGDGKSAAFWRLEHEWVFERTLLRYRILGEFEDGHTTTYWEGTVAWDPRLEIARVLQVHRAGIFGWGELRRLSADAVRFQVTFWHPGGGAELFRDDMRWTEPGTMETRSQTYDATAWKWIEKRVERWTLVAAEAATEGAGGGDPLS